MAVRDDRRGGWRQKIRQRFSGMSRELHILPSYLHETEGPVKLDPDWINIDTLRLWLWTCDRQHGDRCEPTKSAMGYPQWLVDVERLCLVKATPGDRYVALSYVWGQVECAQALQSNLEQLQQPGSISDFSGTFVIPRTIGHAIRLVALLGEKLLWVDSLCIVQDDLESKHVQLQEMAAIYANAYVTVIAANGWDANHGLRGIRGITESRMISANAEQEIFDSLQPYSTIWYSRGWTFQELIFSRRKIMFQYQMAIWECSCGVWHEATGRPEMLSNTATGQARDVFTLQDGLPPPSFVSCTPFEVKPNLDWPDLRQYMNLVRNYNDRQLTFPEDIIAGFSGVLSILSDIFVGGFIYGLPEMFFDVALLWQPASPLERRLLSSKNSSISLPSWSWAGWRGDINQDSWASGYVRMNSRSPNLDVSSFQYKIKSICQWSCGDGTTWRKLDIAHYKYLNDRVLYIEESKKLPQDWSMEFAGRDEHCFIHKSIPTAKFFYPVVMGATRSQSTNDSGHLLFCRTRRVRLYIGPQMSSNVLCSLRQLITKDGQQCGIIRLNISPTYIIDGSLDPLVGTACELVAISEGSAPFLAWHGNEYTRIIENRTDNETDEFYNVLWIEWVDGIAYRKALGEATKHIWDSYPEEWIDVTLG